MGKSVKAASQRCAICSRKFEPILKGQCKCVKCIMAHEPSRPTSDCVHKDEPAFVEWFIYHWRSFRQAAAQSEVDE